MCALKLSKDKRRKPILSSSQRNWQLEYALCGIHVTQQLVVLHSGLALCTLHAPLQMRSMWWQAFFAQLVHEHAVRTWWAMVSQMSDSRLVKFTPACTSDSNSVTGHTMLYFAVVIPNCV
jgi:hypothetical protein